jgi:selenophosphate synthetase-related protein
MRSYLISYNLCLFKVLSLQGGGQEGDRVVLAQDSPHPHPNPPLEGEGVFSSGDQRFF